MKKIWRYLFILALLPLLAACGGKNQENVVTRLEQSNSPTLRWGVKYDTELLGFYNIEKDKLEGFDIDIAKEISKRLGAEPKFVEVTSKTRIPMLKNGNIDAIAATMTITDERKKQVDFTEPYFIAGQGLLVAKDSMIKSVKDLKANTRVAAVKGSTSAKKIHELNSQIPVLEYENYSEAFTALKSGQVDVFTTDNVILLGFQRRNPGYHILSETFTEEPYGIATNNNQDELRDKINQALDQMHKDGSYDRLFKKWFKNDIKTSEVED